MTYDLSPQITRLTPFNSDGGALASVDVNFGPIMIRAKLRQSQNGPFLSWPSRKNETTDKWYDYIAIADPKLKVQAQEMALRHYKTLSEGELVAV